MKTITYIVAPSLAVFTVAGLLANVEPGKHTPHENARDRHAEQAPQIIVATSTTSAIVFGAWTDLLPRG